MKKVINVGIGGKSFVMEEDAYAKLTRYLDKFKTHAKMGVQTKEVMDDLEGRIAELFLEELNSYQDVINLMMVNRVIVQLGMPDGDPFIEGDKSQKTEQHDASEGDFYQIYSKPSRRLYRDTINKSIGGVCSGLAVYAGMDVLLIRILFVIAFLFGTTGFWIYVILWIAIPLADTPVRKCEMYGLPVTAENLRRFANMK